MDPSHPSSNIAMEFPLMTASIHTAGTIGAGTMGNGIAQARGVSGFDVVMVDIPEAAVQRGVATMAGSLDRLLKKGRVT
jgi:3-hydroxybutyryl-CoA dehydrogenase